MAFCKYEKTGHVARITISRPEVMNPLHPPAGRELQQAWDDHDGERDADPGPDPPERPRQEPEPPPADGGQDGQQQEDEVEAVHAPRRATVRKPVWATMRWSGRTAWPSTYQPRWRTSFVAAPKNAERTSVSRSCTTCVTLGV